MMGYGDLKELLKDAKNFATGANDLQLKGVLLDIQDAVYELQDENRELRLKVEELENNNILGSEIEFKSGAYYRNEDGPFCTKCWDVDNKLVRLSTLPRDFGRMGTHTCANCENPFTIKKD